MAVAAGLWGMDALIRRPLAKSTQAATIVLGEHVLLVLVFLPVIAVALPALWRAGPRYVAAGVVIGAGSSALATILFTQAFVEGDPVTPVVLQKVQPLVAVSLAAAALWALGTVLGRFLALELPFQQVTAVRFAFGLPASLLAVLVLGAPLTASLHDQAFIFLLAIVTGFVALLLYYYGLQRTTASVASVAELTFPVVAIAVGYLALDGAMTSTGARLGSSKTTRLVSATPATCVLVIVPSRAR